MKKCIFVMFLLGGLMLSSVAQRSTSSGNFKGGLRLGITASQISGDDLTGFHKVGAYAGLFVNFPLTDNLKWKIQPELDFVMKGSHTYFSKNQTVTNKYILNLGYLEVPVMFKWMVVNNLELEFGPAFGVLLYQKERGTNGPILYRPAFHRFEFSGMCGIAYSFKDHFGVSLRYSNSIIPVRIPNWAINRSIKKQFSSVLALSATYQF